MFDFSFGEIGLIAVVALVVLGPERLPKVARTAGALVRRARSSWQSVKDEIERELEAEELKRSLNDARAAADDLRNDIRSASTEIHSTTQSVAAEMTSAPSHASTSPALSSQEKDGAKPADTPV